MCARDNLTEPSTENVALEEGQQPNNKRSHIEKASGSTTPNEEPDRTVSRRRTDLEQPGAYQLLDGARHAAGSDEMSTSIQGNESGSTMVAGGHFGEECCSVLEMDPIAGRPQSPQLGTEDASGHSICNGGDGNALLQGEQVELVDRMERPEYQPFPLQECGIQVNVLSVPIQETELYGSQESGTCQTLAWNHPLQEMKQPALRQPRRTFGLLACHQPCDDGSVNVVSSLGRIQQPIEHCCGRQEIRLWQGQLDRLVLHQLNHCH